MTQEEKVKAPPQKQVKQKKGNGLTINLIVSM